MNMTGPKKYRGKNANHFSPSAVFFKPEEYWLIVQTNIAFTMAVALFAFCIYSFGTDSLTLLTLRVMSPDFSHHTGLISTHPLSLTYTGFAAVSAYYLIPYMIANYHLVLITYLQHTDVFMPHFRGTEWTWLRGN